MKEYSQPGDLKKSTYAVEKMAVEIERKFLLRNDDWRLLAPGTRYCQGYLCNREDCTVRVRLAGDEAFLTIKGKREGGRTPEFEYPLPPDEAEEMLARLAQKPLIEKVRHAIPYEGLVWEVDEFFADNQGLVMAEVELSHPDQSFAKPAWVGEEVTGDPRFYNASLVRNPYRLWRKARS